MTPSIDSDFRVLCLDGGGIRGAFSAALVAEIEANVEGEIWEYFDLIVGTSTGGIIAIALALGLPAATVRTLYENDGARIFGWRQRGVLGPWLEPKYSNSALKGALQKAFGTARLEDAKTRLVVPSVNLTTGSPTTFKTPHLLDASTRDRKYSAVDVALATSAAPTFFEDAAIGGEGSYCDGGLWANNPAVVGCVEAHRILGRPAGRRVSLLSIGTGKVAYSLSPPKRAGVRWWATGGPRLLDVTLDAQSQSADFMAGFLVDGAYDRINFALPDKSWSLDNRRHLPDYLHLGKQEAHGQLQRLRGTYFKKKASPASFVSGG